MNFDSALRLQKAQAVWTSEVVEVGVSSGSKQKFELTNASQELQESTIVGLRCDFSPVTASGTVTPRTGSNASGLPLLNEDLARKARLYIETEGRIITIPLHYLNVNGKPVLYAPVFIKGFVASKSHIMFGTALPANINEVAEIQFIVGDRIK